MRVRVYSILQLCRAGVFYYRVVQIPKTEPGQTTSGSR